MVEQRSNVASRLPLVGKFLYLVILQDYCLAGPHKNSWASRYPSQLGGQENLEAIYLLLLLRESNLEYYTSNSQNLPGLNEVQYRVEGHYCHWTTHQTRVTKLPFPSRNNNNNIITEKVITDKN